ncbi:MAG: tRNA (adenosine(37)-N6)-threonylcarbamoyltransferase complex dimerization subunit type 1 TsaB, partial [Cycloclasticus sp.]|nr:tRNA (adenosine(37)-N6)-threonylcarbamoyltransferase complex dimerization subunit type 1 TsaB [Cycloclasticus sp.]
IQGLAFGVDLPVAPVSTLAALAQQALPKPEGQTLYAALDARMGEVYWCEYTNVKGVLKAVSNECVTSPLKIKVQQEKMAIGIGHGWDTYGNELTQLVNAKELLLLPNALPRAREVAQLAVGVIDSGQAVSADNALPVYLRDNVAKKKAQQ